MSIVYFYFLINKKTTYMVINYIKNIKIGNKLYYKIKIIFLIFSLEFRITFLILFLYNLFWKLKINKITILPMPHKHLTEYLTVGTIMTNGGIYSSGTTRLFLKVQVPKIAFGDSSSTIWRFFSYICFEFVKFVDGYYSTF